LNIEIFAGSIIAMRWRRWKGLRGVLAVRLISADGC
jgi:hypothetical protein